MNTIATLIARNKEFAAHGFSANLTMMPALLTMIVSCADPRVEPAHVLGLATGEAVTLRNIGGRITPSTLAEMALLGTIARSEGFNPPGGLNLIVLHHTDCGITRLANKPAMLAQYLGVSPAELAAKQIMDPYAAVMVDVAALQANNALPANWIVSGLVYDVASGLIEIVLPPAPLHDSANE